MFSLVESCGRSWGRVNEHGFDFKAHCVNDYAAKIESAYELASHGTKQARKKGKTLPQLLDRAAVGDKKSGCGVVARYVCPWGRMRFHAGNLPKKLGIPCPSEWEDEERAAASMLRQRLSLPRFVLHTPSFSTSKPRIQGPGAVVWP